MKFLSGIAFSTAADSSPVAVLQDISFSSRRMSVVFGAALRSLLQFGIDGRPVRFLIIQPPVVKTANPVRVERLGKGDAPLQQLILCACIEVRMELVAAFTLRRPGSPRPVGLEQRARDVGHSQFVFVEDLPRVLQLPFALSSVTFLFHIERNSIQCSPKSPDTIWHAFSKSCVISSLITASLNGHLPAPISAANDAVREDAPALLTSGGVTASSPTSPKVASTLRRVYAMHSASCDRGDFPTRLSIIHLLSSAVTPEKVLLLPSSAARRNPGLDPVGSRTLTRAHGCITTILEPVPGRADRGARRSAGQGANFLGVWTSPRHHAGCGSRGEGHAHSHRKPGTTGKLFPPTKAATRFPHLLPGHYELKVEKEGFETQAENRIVVETASISTVDVTLKVGSATETVSVDATLPLLQTESSAVTDGDGRLVDNASITKLPLIFWISATCVRRESFSAKA